MCIIAQVARVQFSIEPQRRFYSFSINKKCLFISHFCKGGGNATLRSKGTSFVERKPTLITVVPLPESLKILLTIDAKTYWELQLKKYPAAFFYTVMDAINLSSQLASDWLIQYMFSDEDPTTAKKKATKIVKKLNANNKSHSRHFTVDFCKELGLNITELESDQTLQELVLSVHHAFIITIDATAATKLIENQNGARYITSQKK